MALQRKSRADIGKRAQERGALAALVVARRQELNLSQRELADLAGVSPRFVHALEAGGADVGLFRLVTVLETLGLHLTLERGGASDVIAGSELAQHFGLPPAQPGTGA